MEHWQEAVSQANQLISKIDAFRIPDLDGYPHVVDELREALDRIRVKAITLQSRMTLDLTGDEEPSDDEASLLTSQDREEEADRELKAIQETERMQERRFQDS